MRVLIFLESFGGFSCTFRGSNMTIQPQQNNKNNIINKKQTGLHPDSLGLSPNSSSACSKPAFDWLAALYHTHSVPGSMWLRSASLVLCAFPEYSLTFSCIDRLHK